MSWDAHGEITFSKKANPTVDFEKVLNSLKRVFFRSLYYGEYPINFYVEYMYFHEDKEGIAFSWGGNKVDSDDLIRYISRVTRHYKINLQVTYESDYSDTEWEINTYIGPEGNFLNLTNLIKRFKTDFKQNILTIYRECENQGRLMDLDNIREYIRECIE